MLRAAAAQSRRQPPCESTVGAPQFEQNRCFQCQSVSALPSAMAPRSPAETNGRSTATCRTPMSTRLASVFSVSSMAGSMNCAKRGLSPLDAKKHPLAMEILCRQFARIEQGIERIARFASTT